MESRNKGAGCSTKRECGLGHIVLGNSTHLTKSSVRRCRDGFPHLEMHSFIHSEPSFHCTEMDVAAHVILTSRLSHPYIKQPRELQLIHLFATEDGSVSKLFY